MDPKKTVAPESAGEALLIDHGFSVINTTNGKLECLQLPLIIGGNSSGNIRDMLTSKAAVALEWAKKSELSTDPTSPDDDPRKD